MLLLDATRLPAYLRDRRLLGPREYCRIDALSGGVSNVVLRVEPEGRAAFVVKQSREQLQTEVPWYSRLDRILRETAVMEAVRPLLPEGAIPRILDEDRENYAYTMQAVDAAHVVWKRELLSGRIREEIAVRLAEYLSAIHTGTQGRNAIAEAFEDREVFEQLRVDPFYRHIARVHPELSSRIAGLIEEMEQNRLCLVHGDFSPKNVLLVDRRPTTIESASASVDPHLEVTLIDFETGHYGDPAFDLGFFLSHLLLKGVRSGPDVRRFERLIEIFWDRYRTEIGAVDGSPQFDLRDLERRATAHLAACALARIDGTSPVDYLSDPADRQLVREFSSHVLREPVARLSDAMALLNDGLRTRSAAPSAERPASDSHSLPQPPAPRPSP
jgi:5-methylthioribose kinase